MGGRKKAQGTPHPTAPPNRVRVRIAHPGMPAGPALSQASVRGQWRETCAAGDTGLIFPSRRSLPMTRSWPACVEGWTGMRRAWPRTAASGSSCAAGRGPVAAAASSPVAEHPCSCPVLRGPRTHLGRGVRGGDSAWPCQRSWAPRPKNSSCPSSETPWQAHRLPAPTPHPKEGEGQPGPSPPGPPSPTTGGRCTHNSSIWYCGLA